MTQDQFESLCFLFTIYFCHSKLNRTLFDILEEDKIKERIYEILKEINYDDI